MWEKWISIKERLPEKPSYPYKAYLVWKKGPNGPIDGGIAEVTLFSREKNCFINEGYFNYCIITHWMNLPEDPITHNQRISGPGGPAADACCKIIKKTKEKMMDETKTEVQKQDNVDARQDNVRKLNPAMLNELRKNRKNNDTKPPDEPDPTSNLLRPEIIEALKNGCSALVIIKDGTKMDCFFQNLEPVAGIGALATFLMKFTIQS